MEKEEELNRTETKTLHGVQKFTIAEDLSKAKKLEYHFITNQDTSRREFKPPK
ncbi:hypothetical protein [Methanosarcina mazei]|uniref:hypothetical protein n=1 Tax=Methanosarcina mazei TaxID=2209 RepID=UPI000AFD31E4|nr:hypothetical protein [Methanosarcina mazei]